MFELQSHKLKLQCPRMQNQALPKHPCSWWLFLCPPPSFSLSPSRLQRWGCWSPEFGLDLEQQKKWASGKRETWRKAPGTIPSPVTGCPSGLITSTL